MLPAVGLRNLVSRLNTVVLPAPFGPIKAWIVPRLTARLTSRTATKPLNSLVNPRVSRMTSSDIPTCLPARCSVLGTRCTAATLIVPQTMARIVQLGDGSSIKLQEQGLEIRALGQERVHRVIRGGARGAQDPAGPAGPRQSAADLLGERLGLDIVAARRDQQEAARAHQPGRQLGELPIGPY